MHVTGFTSAANATPCSSRYRVIAACFVHMAPTRVHPYRRADSRPDAAAKGALAPPLLNLVRLCRLRLLGDRCVFTGMKTETSEICVTNAFEQAGEGVLLVDVRERRDVRALGFGATNIVNLPFSELEKGWQALPRDREILVACQNGEKSLSACQFLQKRGYLNVSSVRGGILLWMQKGYPVVGRRFTAPNEATEE